MSVNTNNIYGEISISDQAIAKFVSHVAMGMLWYCRVCVLRLFCYDSRSVL